ncbi:SAM-dependent methyltransferase [Actinokineospora bangkokensis]|uniref:S-adenosyl-L-methionine-dependent methyltransferase n=1 Tax=Actinokineospora bangkokensis TaxID=1193682 RepID=A0A1Q9LPF1_9PSEU|nr:SAM-dependent methyltransferase [Actinokineospora bangkokensis]OLR93881.1 hypothetical protein BJP25_14745 [Actinokineospora bangkokensis]
MPGGVGATAIGVAAVRARESLRRDRLFHDPHAQRFLHAAGWPTPAGEYERPDRDGLPRWNMVVLSIPIRTRFVDDCLRDATAGGCGQVVVLGAGLDTRAFRLDWPAGTTVFEVDVPEVLAFKDSVLAGEGPRCARRVSIPADLTLEWAAPLLAAGFDPAAPTAWVAEGLVGYLSTEQNDSVLRELGRLSAPGSRLVVTTSADDPAASAGDGAAWLSGYGWTAASFDPAECAAAYGRPGVFDRFEPRPSHRGYLTAVRTG